VIIHGSADAGTMDMRYDRSEVLVRYPECHRELWISIVPVSVGRRKSTGDAFDMSPGRDSPCAAARRRRPCVFAAENRQAHVRAGGTART